MSYANCDPDPCGCVTCEFCTERVIADEMAPCPWCGCATHTDCMTHSHGGERICQSCYDEEYADEIAADQRADAKIKHERDMR